MRRSLAPDLLLAARSLLNDVDAESASMRRAVSTAYYAVFHTLAELCAETLLPLAEKSANEYVRIYRALDHGSIRTVFAQTFRSHVRFAKVAEAVIRLQAERHKADYAPPEPLLFSPKKASELIDLATITVEDLQSIDPYSADARLLATCLLFKDRRS